MTKPMSSTGMFNDRNASVCGWDGLDGMRQAGRELEKGWKGCSNTVGPPFAGSLHCGSGLVPDPMGFQAALVESADSVRLRTA